MIWGKVVAITTSDVKVDLGFVERPDSEAGKRKLPKSYTRKSGGGGGN